MIPISTKLRTHFKASTIYKRYTTECLKNESKLIPNMSCACMTIKVRIHSMELVDFLSGTYIAQYTPTFVLYQNVLKAKALSLT